MAHCSAAAALDKFDLCCLLEVIELECVLGPIDRIAAVGRKRLESAVCILRATARQQHAQYILFGTPVTNVRKLGTVDHSALDLEKPAAAAVQPHISRGPHASSEVEELSHVPPPHFEAWDDCQRARLVETLVPQHLDSCLSFVLLDEQQSAKGQIPETRVAQHRVGLRLCDADAAGD